MRLSPLALGLAFLVACLLLLGPREEAHSAAAVGGGAGERPTLDTRAEHQKADHQKCRVCRMGESLGITLTPVYGVSRFRCSHNPSFELRWPAGVMRPQDMLALPMRISVESDTEGMRASRVEIRAGDHLLYEERTVWPESAWCDYESQYCLHAKAHAALRGVRSRLTLTFQFEGYGPPLERGFWVESPEAALNDCRRRIDRRLQGRDLWLRDLLYAQTWFRAGFYFAADLCAQRVLCERPKEPHAQAIRYALYRMHRLKSDVQAQNLGSDLTKARDALAAAGMTCHLHADFDPLDGRAFLRPRGGCGSGRWSRTKPREQAPQTR